MSAANGIAINTFGTRLLENDLGLRRSFTLEFILAQVNRTIIGTDFLSQFGFLVDLIQKRLVDSLTSMSVDADFASVCSPSTRNLAVDVDYGIILK